METLLAAPRTSAAPQPSPPSNYYSGDKYYNSPSDLTASNRKHFRNKLHSKKKKNKSTTDLDSITSTTHHPLSLNYDDPYLSSLSTTTIQSTPFYVSPSSQSTSHPDTLKAAAQYYIEHDGHGADGGDDHGSDIAVEPDSDAEIEVGGDADDGQTPGVRLVDSSSDISVSLDRGVTDGVDLTDIERAIIESNKESAHHPLLGMIMVTLSAVMYSGLNLSVKVLMLSTPWQELMFIRMGITWVATTIWILVQYRGKLHLFGPPHQRLLLLLRAFFLWAAMFTCWWSFEFLPVGDGTTLAMSFPVWVSVFAHFVWKDSASDASSQRLDLFGWICVLSGLLGIAFVAQPSFIFGGVNTETSASRRDIGIIIGMGSAICAGAQYVIVNYTKRDCHWLQVEQITAALSTFVLCPLGFVCFALAKYSQSDSDQFEIDFVNLDGARWAEEISLGLLGFLALALLTRGSQLDAPSRTAICLYLEIPFVYVGQCVMERELPNVYVFVGIVLVLCSVMVPAVRKLRRATQQRQFLQKLQQRLRNEYGDEEAIDGEDTALLSGAGAINVVAGSGVTVCEWSSEDE